MIKLENLNEMRNEKLLLAFSHGSDSTALFFLLKQAGVEFDCALVNYRIRASADLEQAAAAKLCKAHNKRFFSISVKLDGANFEAKARQARRDFFVDICKEHGYTGLVFAHQLNDYFEWFLMRLKRGSGLVNLLGFDEKLGDISVFRPLKYTPKDEIIAFLRENEIEYFFDESNNDESFERNFIRKKFSDEFVRLGAAGLARSFEALSVDKELLLGQYLYENNEIFVFANSGSAINLADKALKKLGVLLSKDSRAELQTALESEKSVVFSHKVALCASKNLVFVAPFIKVILEKDFKEKCRKAGIPSKIRGFLADKNEIFKDLLSILKES